MPSFWDFLTSNTPGGAVVSTAKVVTESVFNGVDKIIRDFKLPPEVQVEFEKFKTEQLGKIEAIDAADRNSARQREMAVKDWTPSLLGWTILIIFAIANYFVFTHPLPQGNEMLISRVLGTLDMAIGLILGYYYGTSASSRQKDQIISTIATKDK